MKQRFSASITPSPDALRMYLEAALGYVNDVKEMPDKREFCLEHARAELRDALDYLGYFEAANEVLIFRGVRIKGHIGEKRAVGKLEFRDVADDILKFATARGTLKAGE